MLDGGQNWSNAHPPQISCVIRVDTKVKNVVAAAARLDPLLGLRFREIRTVVVKADRLDTLKI